MPIGPDPIRFDTYIHVRAPGALPEMIEAGAASRLCSRSEYIRQAIIDRLAVDGLMTKRAG